RAIAPNVVTFSTLVAKAPDYAGARHWFEIMQREGVAPNVSTFSSLFSSDLSEVSPDELLAWYLSLPYHPDTPLDAAIANYRKRGLTERALRIALDYPYLPSAAKLFRSRKTAAVAFFESVLRESADHPNASYALGIALMVAGDGQVAIPHLEKARALATAGQRRADCDRRLAEIREETPTLPQGAT
ncbi:MAG TPA: hypothetical protein VM118_09505, partial [Acidobacteriota bacterium]|nr:hypothetical protein [Acidobacteriota bacterium]